MRKLTFEMKRLLTGILIVTMMISIAGCSVKPVSEDIYKDEATALYPLVFEDKFGEEVVIEQEPTTVISMSPELTEIIYALGAGEKVIGRSQYCNYPAEVEEVTEYGSLFNLNVESIVEAAPDILFLSSMAEEELVNNLKGQGLVVVTVDKDSELDGTYDYITLLGEMLNKDQEATALNEKIKSEIAEVKAKVEGLEKPSVYYVLWAGEGSASTATGDTFQHGILEAAGGDNVAKDGTGWSYSVEKLVEDDPYMLICPVGDMKSSIENLAGYSDLTAVKEGRVYTVDEDILSRQGPRLGEAVRAIAQILHPEAFQE